MLEVSDLRAGYGPQDVLHDLSFTVADGEIVVILGANGAGKTTTMRAISGTVRRRGSIRYDGAEISKCSADETVRHGIAHVPQGRGTFPDLTVAENLAVGGYIRPERELAADRDRWFDTFPRLAERRDQKAGQLSGGEQQMLAIARALMGKPKLLLCDEPSLGLAPLITQNLFQILTDLNAELGTAILLVEQNANLAIKVAHRGYVLETGRIVVSGTAAELAGDDSIKKAYLGI
jgi:branched-chain amino acid transport system ATP-binding protein